MSVFNESLPVITGNEYYNIVLFDGPISYWRLNETSGTTVTDSVDSNNGTYIAGYTLNQTGFSSSGVGVLFDGSSGYVNIPTASNLRVTNLFTLEAIVKLTSSPRSGVYSQIAGSRYLNTGSPYTDFSINAEVSGQVFEGEIGIGGTLYQIDGTTVPTAGIYYHLVFTYDGSTAILYINGVSEGSSSVSGTVNYSAQPFNIGVSYSAGSTLGNFFPGVISNVSVYNYALSATQVSNHYAAISDSYNVDIIPFSETLTYNQTLVEILPIGSTSVYQTLVQSEPTIVSYWKLDEISGTVAVDSVGANSGTYTGGVTLFQFGFGNSGRSALFDGSSGHIAFSTPTNLPVGAANFAFEALFKLTASTVPNPVSIIGYGEANNDTDCALLLNINTEISLFFYNDDLNATGLTNFFDSNWHHVVAQFDGTNQTIYLDGTLVGTGTLTGTKATTLDNLNIGINPDIFASPYQGYLSNIAIYNDVLSPTQITAHYNAITASINSDIIAFTDLVLVIQPISVSLSDTLTFTQHTGLIFSVSLSDTISFIDHPSYHFHLANRSFSDTFSFSNYMYPSIGSYHYPFHDQIIFNDHVIATEPLKIFQSLSDTLNFSDKVIGSGSVIVRALSDTLVFAQPFYNKFIEGLVVSVPILIAGKVANLVPVPTPSPTPTPIPSPPENGAAYYASLPYVTLTNGADVVVLPGPLFGNTQQNVGSVTFNRAVNGKVYTIVKKTARQRLKWKFQLKRQKAYELKLFIDKHNIDYMNITDWLGNTWYMKIINNPIVFEAISRDSINCQLYNEYIEAELEFEGVIVSSQLPSCV